MCLSSAAISYILTEQTTILYEKGAKMFINLFLLVIPYALMIIYMWFFIKKKWVPVSLLFYVISILINNTYLAIFFFIWESFNIAYLIFLLNNNQIKINYFKLMVINFICIGIFEFSAFYFGDLLITSISFKFQESMTPLIMMYIVFWQLYVAILLQLIFNRKHKLFCE
ncbi:MAG: hypothetical protein JWN78_411 [Bacteroidota bacterium]|nr:hypothetical protein [Bacteroidota bacterium]